MKPFKCALKKVSRGSFKCAQTKKKRKKKFQRSSSSVPKQRQYVRKHFKGVPQGCINNRKKRSKKSFKEVPQVCPNKKKCS